MKEVEPKPQLLNRAETDDTRGMSTNFCRVIIPVTAEGGYNGNGKFQDPGGKIFRITGFDKLRKGGDCWYAEAFIEKRKPSI